MADKTIKLSCFGIEITLIDPEPLAWKKGDRIRQKWGGGSITSDLKEACPYCKDPQCDMNCTAFSEHCSDRDPAEQKRKEQEAIEFNKHRAAADTIESLVLAHAIAGVDVESPAYLEGIETCHNAMANNL